MRCIASGAKSSFASVSNFCLCLQNANCLVLSGPTVLNYWAIIFYNVPEVRSSGRGCSGERAYFVWVGR